MPFIQLKDGILIEIREQGHDRQETSGGAVKGIPKTMEDAVAMLPILVTSIGNAFRGLQQTLDIPIKVGEAEVELGLSFSMEGNLYVAKAKAEGTLSIKIKFTPIDLSPSEEVGA